MRFNPVTNKYKELDSTLVEGIPNYMQRPIADWAWNLLNSTKYITHPTIGRPPQVNTEFVNSLNTNFREHFPKQWMDFINFALEEDDRAIDFIAFCLQNIARLEKAKPLEDILETSGSAWTVLPTKKDIQTYDIGAFTLTRRVPETVVQVSEAAIQGEELIRRAWIAHYSRNPDHAATVSQCVDFLEGLLMDTYSPNTQKPVLTKLINELEQDPSKLVYKGNTIVDPKDLVTRIAKQFIQIRGQHTTGTGRHPTAEEAEFVLHYTIFIWNIHRGI